MDGQLKIYVPINLSTFECLPLKLPSSVVGTFVGITWNGAKWGQKAELQKIRKRIEMRLFSFVSKYKIPCMEQLRNEYLFLYQFKFHMIPLIVRFPVKSAIVFRHYLVTVWFKRIQASDLGNLLCLCTRMWQKINNWNVNFVVLFSLRNKILKTKKQFNN